MQPGRSTREAIKAGTDADSGSGIWQYPPHRVCRRTSTGRCRIWTRHPLPDVHARPKPKAHRRSGAATCRHTGSRWSWTASPAFAAWPSAQTTRYFYCQRSVEGDYDMYARGLEIIAPTSGRSSRKASTSGVPSRVRSDRWRPTAPPTQHVAGRAALRHRQVRPGGGTWEVIHEADDIHNAHPQVGSRAGCADQNNRGSLWTDDGTNPYQRAGGRRCL